MIDVFVDLVDEFRMSRQINGWQRQGLGATSQAGRGRRPEPLLPWVFAS